MDLQNHLYSKEFVLTEENGKSAFVFYPAAELISFLELLFLVKPSF